MRFVNLWVLFLALGLSGCGTVDMNALREMVGLSKRTYTTKPEPTAAQVPGASAPAAPPAPVVITPPASRNANADAPDFIAYRIAAAKKIMQANASITYGGGVPDRLLSIPVLEIDLNSDGSVKSIDVLRKPHFAPESIDLAKAAIQRAAPFGSVAHLPQPWQFNETFLFNDDLKFQLHSLQP